MINTGPSTLLKQCQKCGMQFDNYEHLTVHQKRFCSDSDYGTIPKLENKYQEYMNPQNPENPILSTSPDRQFKKLKDLETQNRELEMQGDINRIKQEKAALRFKKMEEEQALATLMKGIEDKNERRLQERIEKDNIRKDLMDLEKNKLKHLEEEKKNQLDNLAVERDLLRQKEQQIIKEVARYENGIKNLDMARDEEVRRMDDALDKFRKKGDENVKVQDLLMKERSDRVAELKMRRENLEFERQRILEDQEKARNGDLSGAKRPNYGLFAANQMLGTMNAIKNYDIGNIRQALTFDQQRINNLKTDQQNIVRNEHIYPDFLNVAPSTTAGRFANGPNSFSLSTPEKMRNSTSGLLGRSPASPFTTNANNILSSNNLFPNQSQSFGSPSLQKQGDNQYGNNPAPAQALSEVIQLKNKYISGGGQDPNFIGNFENLENFYKGVASRNVPQNLDQEQTDPQLQKLIDQKDQENEKIRKEIELLKLQNSRLPNGPQGNNFTLADMNLKLNGLGNKANNMFSIYTGGNEFFIQNQARSVDLNGDEKMAVNVAAQEVDSLRLLSQIPVSTEIYRFKLEQFKELSTTRAEMEKILQEQRLLKMRRDFEKLRREEDRKFENEKWVDEQRKNIIANRLRKDLNPGKQSKQYDPTEGLVLHWDYLLSVPKRNDSCQIVYGIYINGTEVYPPSMLEPHPCEVDTSVTNRCLFGKTHAVTEIPANANTLLIFEVQLFPNKDSQNPTLTSFGWSQLDLFDARRELKRGKFKVPLYECPTDINQDIDGIRDLTPVQNGTSWMYLRISYPSDDEIAKVQSIYPENTHMEYNIPQIHLRNFRPAMDAQFSQPVYPNYMRNPTPAVPYQNNYPQPQPQQLPQFDQSTIDQSRYLNPPQQSSVPNTDRKPPMDNRSNITQTQTFISSGQKKALQVIIHSIKNHVARSNLKVSCALYEGNQIAVDDMTRNDCVYNTSVHNPLDGTKMDGSTISGGGPKAGNKAQGNNIVFREDHVFMKDIYKVIQKNNNKKDLYLMFQVLEKPDARGLQDTQNMSYNRSGDGGTEYQLFAWFLFKINRTDGGITVGKFNFNMLAPPLRLPPVDTSKLQKMDAEIEFAINEMDWSDEPYEDDPPRDMSTTKGKPHKKPKKDKDKDKSKRKGNMSSSKANTSVINKTVSGPDLELDNSPFIPNLAQQYIDRTFEKGMGVDFYVDGCRFLPDNATVVRVAVQIVNIDFDIIKSAVANLPDLDGPTYNPLFNFRIEIRPQNFSPTALAFISIDTIDKASNEPKIVGYSGINLFINRYSRNQPESNNDTDIVLYSGNYQLPIYCQEPFRTKPFNMEKIRSLERLPTASILVRIRQAPLSDDKLRVLSLEDVPRKDWEKKQIWVPRPVYAAKAYNTSNYQVKDSEKELFAIRQGKEDPPLRETAQLLLNAENINREMDDKELIDYLDKKIQRTSATGLIDLLYFAKYRPEAGFKFALDGLHNMKVAQPYVGLYSMNPPGDFYVYDDGDEPNTSKLQLNADLEWEGPLYSPRFGDGYLPFKDLPFSKNLHIIVDIRTVNLMTHPPQFSHVGWTIVPIFTPDGFVLSGLYQIPLIAGQVNKNIVQELPESDPWAFILDQIKAKKIKWLEKSSVMVRLVDAQREGHFEQPWDFTRVDYRYIPKKDLQKYAYNSNADENAKTGKRLKTIVPNKGNPSSYQTRITEAFIKELGLTQFENKTS